MLVEAPPWSLRTPLAEIQRGPKSLRLEADTSARERIARALQLIDLDSLTADVVLSPWMDGAQVHGRWHAHVSQTCGVSLEPFETLLKGEFRVNCAPRDSSETAITESELILDLDADDPPDVLEDGQIDAAAYVVEHLALELDPFPRKPGVHFEPPVPTQPASPFAVLIALKPDSRA